MSDPEGKIWEEANKAFAAADRAFAASDRLFRSNKSEGEFVTSTATTVTTLRLSGGRWSLFFRLMKQALVALWSGKATICIRRKVT